MCHSYHSASSYTEDSQRQKVASSCHLGLSVLGRGTGERGLSGLSARRGVVTKAKSDKTPSFVGLKGLFYEKYALLWQKGRIRYLVCFLLLAHWPMEGG